MNTRRIQTFIFFMTTLTVCVLTCLISVTYSSSSDSAIFSRLHNFNGYLHTTYNLTQLIPVKSRTDCARVCMTHPECVSFFHLHTPKQMCQTHSVVFMTTKETVFEPRASYYQITQGWCPHKEGYILYRPSSLCYKHFMSLMSWDEAKRKCESITKHLLHIKTPDASQHIINYLMASSNLRTTRVSVGGRFVSGSWRWTDGTPVTWTNWGGSEPNNPVQEPCMGLAPTYKFKWYDVRCDVFDPSVPKAYICQWNI